MIYAGFWPRFAALWLDLLVMSPLLALSWWGGERFRLFHVYYLLPGTAFGFFYGVYLVRHFGGTPGKRLMKIRITKVSGEPVTYREALLRYLPESLMAIASSLAFVVGVLHLTDAQFLAAPSFVERNELIMSAAPTWYLPVELAMNIWFWSEFVVMLTNRRRRAIHDFIAGTVVIKDAQPTVAGAGLAPLDRV